MKNKRETGFEYEEIAKKFLEEKNLSFITSNYYTRYGEVDLIFFEKLSETLVFVEVKYRKKSIYGTAVETVDRKKQEKILLSSQIYIIENEWNGNIRYDIIGITGNKSENNINWIKNAF
ncbi:YraN family protein [Leptotrichia sp. OH3620_COT-345]|uniref:YraN family protein n=1 Tax=Leptotrichia sp. OH3620_COT-345 TaxID=2491048 RepID=UPI000F64D3FD|nr:YraN family protein [Leptotrichia sp. OH3620_COT-345]RRD40978.1 YraN family protein [Leptotrichia sp. OH3620_COT-345]